MNDLEEIRKEIDNLKQRNQKKTRYKKEKHFSAMVICSEVVGSVFLAVLLGVFLDKLFETQFIFKLSLLFLSLISVIYSFYKMTRR